MINEKKTSDDTKKNIAISKYRRKWLRLLQADDNRFGGGRNEDDGYRRNRDGSRIKRKPIFLRQLKIRFVS